MYLEKLNERQLKEIYQESNITEESLKRDVKYLMEWMEKQAHLPNVKDEQYLSHLLIQCKNSLEKAKKYLDKYYCVKAMLPVLFTNRDTTSDWYKRLFNIGCAVPLPKLTPDGCRVFIYRVYSNKDVQLVGPDDIVKLNYMTLDVAMRHDLTKKHIIIYDIPNMDVTLLTTMFNGSRKYLKTSQNLYTFRIDKIHLIVNMNGLMSTVFNIIKNLMKKKVADRMVIWNNEKPDFTSMFPAEILPEEYGGKEKPLVQLREMYYQYMCGFQDWFKSEESVVADLSKRTDDLYKTSLDESVDGSFRQLIID